MGLTFVLAKLGKKKLLEFMVLPSIHLHSVPVQGTKYLETLDVSVVIYIPTCSAVTSQSTCPHWHIAENLNFYGI